MKKNSIT